jgi:hypothetical protein
MPMVKMIDSLFTWPKVLFDIWVVLGGTGLYYEYMVLYFPNDGS